jgi:hypothetical protein
MKKKSMAGAMLNVAKMEYDLYAMRCSPGGTVYTSAKLKIQFAAVASATALKRTCIGRIFAGSRTNTARSSTR